MNFSIPSAPDPAPADYSTRIANRGDPRLPDTVKREDPDLYRRRYDAKLGCWVREPEPASTFALQRSMRRMEPLPAGRGSKRWLVVDALTGAPFGALHADEATQAMSWAGDWARCCGFAFNDVRVINE